MTDHEVDVLHVADRILKSRRGACSVSVIEAIALASFVKLHTNAVPAVVGEHALKASLSAAIAAVLEAFETKPVDELRLAAAIHKLKPVFEKEFPNEHDTQHCA